MISTVLVLAQRIRPAGQIEFVCDEQRGLHGRFSEVFAMVCDVWRRTYTGDVGQLRFMDSKNVPGIQAADLLAYETRKDLKNQLEPMPRPRSKALDRLLNGKFHIAHYADAVILGRIKHAQAQKRAGLPALDSEGRVPHFPLLYASPTLTEVMPWEITTEPPKRWPWEY